MRDLACSIDVEIGVVGDHSPKQGDINRMLFLEDLLCLLRVDLLTCVSSAGSHLGQAIDLTGGQEEKIARFSGCVLLAARWRDLDLGCGEHLLG